mmetsp:Transcript_49808/g.98866  ORF Transcript_49808/g.98866 Transcript_49808/m.98866 type:complete len:253 (+) Transcript_49808:842-1600(+)
MLPLIPAMSAATICHCWHHRACPNAYFPLSLGFLPSRTCLVWTFCPTRHLCWSASALCSFAMTLLASTYLMCHQTAPNPAFFATPHFLVSSLFHPSILFSHQPPYSDPNDLLSNQFFPLYHRSPICHHHSGLPWRSNSAHHCCHHLHSSSISTRRPRMHRLYRLSLHCFLFPPIFEVASTLRLGPSPNLCHCGFFLLPRCLFDPTLIFRPIFRPNLHLHLLLPVACSIFDCRSPPLCPNFRFGSNHHPSRLL